jgi:hypothetical protein
MKLRFLIKGMALSLLGLSVAMSITAGSTATVKAFLLITPEEAARERSKGPPVRFRGLAKGDVGGPGIVLVQPGSTVSVESPLDIELKFILKPPAKIVRNSLRVLYGFFGLDVTDRLTKHAALTPAGIVAKNASLPPGSHSITIEISDDRGRKSRREFNFDIKEE